MNINAENASIATAVAIGALCTPIVGVCKLAQKTKKTIKSHPNVTLGVATVATVGASAYAFNERFKTPEPESK